MPVPAASEHEPLLPRSSSASFASRCLLWPSLTQLQNALWVLFNVHLLRKGEFAVWAESVIVTVAADVFWLTLAVLGLTIACGCLHCLRTHGCKVTFCCSLCFSWSLTLCWHSMLRMCILHELAVICSFPKICPRSTQDSSLPELSGIIQGFILSWTWVPIGVLRTLGNTLWRPWYLFLHVLPLGLVGQGPLSEMAWWQWREALVGSVFWSCLLLVALGARSRAFLSAEEADRRFLIAVGMGATLLTTLLAFYLTVAPLVAFWKFVCAPWPVLMHSVRQRKKPPFSGEAWLASFAVLWGMARTVYIAASSHLEQWSARQRMEETLRDALAHPFRAELEQGFGLMDGEGGGRLLPALRGFGSRVVLEPHGSLKEKQKTLIAARRQLLLRQAGSEAALPSTLRLSINRKRILEDTWAALFDRPVSELLAPRVSVQFAGEQGVDAGGLTRDWFDSVGRALAEQPPGPEALLARAPDQTLIPMPVGSGCGAVPGPEEQAKFRALMALGRFMALAVFHEHPLPVSFCLILCKYLLRVPVGMGDVRQLDPDFFNGRVAPILRPGGPAEMEAALGEPLTFVSAATDACPEPEELRPGGAKLAVTEENKTEYVQLLCEAYLCSGIRREIQCLLQGFWDVLPPEVLVRSEVGPRELSMLMSGVADLSPSEWREHSEGSGTQVHVWFWELVQEMTRAQRCMLLHFATGSSRLPPGGFADLRPRFNVSVSDSGSSLHLPHAHTCANQIVLYRYESKEQLRGKLLHALLTEDFGFS